MIQTDLVTAAEFVMPERTKQPWRKLGALSLMAVAVALKRRLNGRQPP